MNLRLGWLLISLLGLMALGFYLSGLLPHRAWGIWQQDRWLLVASGWQLLWHTWPIALLGMGLSAGLFWVVGNYLYFALEDKDHRLEIKRLEHKIREAEQRAADAQKSAQAEYQTRLANVEDREQKLTAAVSDVAAAQRTANERVLMAQEIEKNAEKRILEANRRKDNAMGAMGRMKRKLKSKK